MVEPFIWNYIAENELDGDDDQDDNNDNHDNVTTRSRGSELRSDIPLLMSNHLTPPPSVVAITPLPMGHKKLKLNDIDPSVTLLNDDNVEMLYPQFSCTLGWREEEFDITNPSVVKSMQALMTELTIFFVLIMSLK